MYDIGCVKGHDNCFSCTKSSTCSWCGSDKRCHSPLYYAKCGINNTEWIDTSDDCKLLFLSSNSLLFVFFAHTFGSCKNKQKQKLKVVEEKANVEVVFDTRRNAPGVEE
jgi:hypothetical protein